MGDDSLILREDGYIRMNFPVTSLTYHTNLNVILVKTDVGGVHVLDVNSGVILQSSCLSADEKGTLGVEYAPGADRVFVWDGSGVGARTDYNGVLLLHTALQRPLATADHDRSIRVELVLSEAVLLYQCLQGLEGAGPSTNLEKLSDFVKELKNSIDAEPSRKGVKAQKWSTVTLCMPQKTMRVTAAAVVQELKTQNRRVPALAIASAVSQRSNDLVPVSRDEESRPLMYSEAERKETFKSWPHMDYKWALPARMAQAGFYHQPTPSGDDRAMCFACMVCLVCWEKSDEPWVEHERHSPNCAFVRGEYTHNVPISVTNATACAVPSPDVKVVSKGNYGNLIASGTVDGRVNVWKFDCGLKLVKYILLSTYDSIFSGVLTSDTVNVWTNSLERDTSTYGIELTAMAFVGMTSQKETYPQTVSAEITEKYSKPALICAVMVTRNREAQATDPIQELNKALFDSGGSNTGSESIQEMNDQNEAKSNQSNKMLFLLTYDIHNSQAGCASGLTQLPNSSGHAMPGGSKKVCTVARTDDANIYDDIYFQYSDEDTELPPCTNVLLDEQISNVINLNASSSKEDIKIWDPAKKIILTKTFKVVPPPGPHQPLLTEYQESTPSAQASMLDFVGKISQLKSWKSGNLESAGTKVADQPDAALLNSDPHLHHYLNMSTPLEISDLKWYESSDGIDKKKLKAYATSKLAQAVLGHTYHAHHSHSHNDHFEIEPPPEETVTITKGVAVHCLSFPSTLNLREDSRVTHLLPTEDRKHLLVVISSIDPDKVKAQEETDNDGDTKMDVDDADHIEKPTSDAKAYFILYEIYNNTSTYTIAEEHTSLKELPYEQSPVDICLLPLENEKYSFASVGVDGALRLYSLPGFHVLSEQRVPKGQFTSVTYCASVERLSASTRNGMIYFYALNNGEKDSAGDMDEDDLANIDFDMLQRAPQEDTGAPVIIANKPVLETADLETLMQLTGAYGTNTPIPYSAVVPGFWCELSPAQRPRSDHQNNRTWRLQNTSSTWDEHVLELTLPYSVSLAHIDFSFTLHSACTTNLPVIMVTLLKQNLHGIGYKKDAAFSHRSESPTTSPIVDADVPTFENPVYNDDYLQAHNSEILAGPLILSSGLDSTQQSGTLTLTSPRLYRARGRTFLIHIKTLFDPAKDMGKGADKSEDSRNTSKKFIGCDWLHQISLTVRSSPHTEVPLERQQRIAMLESNGFLKSLCEIAISEDDIKKRMLALDIMIWVVSVRLQRMRLANSEKGKDENESVEAQQLKCLQILEQNTVLLIRHCILCGDRSIAKKCVRVLLIASEGANQLPTPWKSEFLETLGLSVAHTVPYIGAVHSAGALRWLCALIQHATPTEAAPALMSRLLYLVKQVGAPIMRRQSQYQHLLRSRFGLYGLPFERTIFAPETPELNRSGPTAGASAAMNDVAPGPPRQEQQLRELLSWPHEAAVSSDPKTAPWWANATGAGVYSLGLGEATPLHVSCHMASEGTKLESTGRRHLATVVSSLHGASVAEPHQLWSAVKESQAKLTLQDPDSLEDVESSMMDCDPHERLDFSEDKLFKEAEQCGIPWAALVCRPPQHTLLVERMHSGARRFIVLDFGHLVRLTDVIIPACSDLVTLCVDVWVTSEETDCVKLAFATDIANRNLVLTDLQPPPLCRYMKITTIGRYGMSAMKCKIPLGWFYGEFAEIANVQASIRALNALHQDLSCRFRLATAKLTDLLNPYIGMYNANACHMMANLHNTEGDARVNVAYNECIELQQQLHTCSNILKKLQNLPEDRRAVTDNLIKQDVSSLMFLENACTDKLRVILEAIVDVLLYFYFHPSDDVLFPAVHREWCTTVVPLVWQCGGLTAGALATLLARACGPASWWGKVLASALTTTFSASLAPPTPLDRCLLLLIYMCRKTTFSHAEAEEGVVQALCSLALKQVRGPRPQPALTAAALTTLAAVLDSVLAIAATNKHSRWDWVSCGHLGSSPGSSSTVSSPRGDCKLHRRKLHKKLLTQMQELEAARRGIYEQFEDQQRTRSNLKARAAIMLGKRGGGKASGSGAEGTSLPRVVSTQLASSLATALVHHMLAADNAAEADTMMLCAKVVGRLCALSGGAHVLEPTSILGLARLAVTSPPWSRHALTSLLQDLVEFENTEASGSPSEEWGGAGASRVIRVTGERAARPSQPKPPRKNKGPTVADLLADSFGLPKTSNSNGSKPKLNPPPGAESPNAAPIEIDAEEQLTQVAESDDSDSSGASGTLEPRLIKKETKRVGADPSIVDRSSLMSRCADARLEGAGGGPGGAGEALARHALLCTGAALSLAVRSPPLVTTSAMRAPRAPDAGHHPPLSHTLYDVFRHLALDFKNQMDCTFMENVLALWLTLNGSLWGSNCTWTMAASLATLSVPADIPRIRLASDTVTNLIQALCTYKMVSLRCWVLSIQTLAWIANLPLQMEGSSQTMGRVILECEYFIPALVKFINMDVRTEGMIASCEPYLAGSNVGAGAGAVCAMQALVSRVLCARGAAGAQAALRVVAGAWAAPGARSYDLHAALMRLVQPLLPVLQSKHAHHGLPLIHAIAEQSSTWVREVGCQTPAPSSGSGDSRGGILVEMVVGSVAGRKAPSRRSVLGQLLAYAKKLVLTPLPTPTPPSSSSSSGSSSAEQSLTDESKAQHGGGGGADSTNMDDEKKQQAARTPCVADTVIENSEIMERFYKTLTHCDGLNMLILNSGGAENGATIKEEVFWLVAHIATVCANPANMVPSLLEFLRRPDIVHLSQAMQQLIIRLLENPEALAAFTEQGGLELAVEKLTLKHLSGPSYKQGLVSSLMNYLKLPPQLVNLSTSANKKTQPVTTDTSDTVNGHINIAPFCTISCGNPTAQAADVLLEGGAGSSGARGACAARRVRAAAWSYHFFSADDSSLALTISLPYAAKLHEVQLQPHLTSLATCPGAVGVEAGCGATVAPLGPPQDTAGMTFIRLVLVQPVVCTTVQLRLYKPRDSSNMGLLQLKLMVEPAFNTPHSPDAHVNSNNWASVVACCTRAGALLRPAQWEALASPGAVGALCACVALGGSVALAAQRALLAAARFLPTLRAPLLHALLDMDKHAYALAFHESSGRCNSSLGMISALVRALCRCSPPQTLRAYVQWVRAAAPPNPNAPAPLTLHTLASVLWMLKEQKLMENDVNVVTDDLFDTIFNWVRAIPESSMLKRALDSILCSMCYIRPELFKMLLQRLNIPVDVDDSMEGLTDDTKVHGSPLRESEAGPGDSVAQIAWRLSGSEVRTVAAAAMSPAAIPLLLNSRLPEAVVAALCEFAEERLDILKKDDVPSDCSWDSDVDFMLERTPTERARSRCMIRATNLVDWVRLVSADARAKEWAGGAGAAFWSPLLALLCCPHRKETSWQTSSQFAELEDSCIKMFAELTACHPHNQKLFATTLHSILEALPQQDCEGISGFARALILRLVLSSERVWVTMAWAGSGVESESASGGVAPSHPALAARRLRPLPLTTTIKDLLTDHRPPLPVMEETSKLSMSNPASSGSASVLRSASDTAITTVAEAWELSLAAASASKDKRVKDVKNTSLKNHNNKKRLTKNDISVVSLSEDLIETTIRVQAAGLEGFVCGSTTLGQLCASIPHVFGPHLSLTLHLNTNGEWSGAARGPAAVTSGSAVSAGAGGAVLREFGACGGLALVAARLPRPHAPPPDPPARPAPLPDLDWVKLDDPYEEVVELGGGGAVPAAEETSTCGVPAHALAALAVLLKLPGYAAALLDEGPRAVHLLRLLMGVSHTEDGRMISVAGGSGGFSLGTLPFRVVSRLLEQAPRRTEDGVALRRTLMQCGAVKMVLACLAVFTHHRPSSTENSQSGGVVARGDADKGQLYWAKGTGFGTGSTQQSWNVEQALVRQRTEEEHVTVLLQVLASYMSPGEQWPPEESTLEEESPVAENSEQDQSSDLPSEFIDLVASSSLVPAICSYLRNDSVLDMSRHIPLYVCVLRCARAVHSLRSPRLAPALAPLPRLLLQMSRTTNSYATKLKMSKKNIFGKMTYSQRFSTSSSSELSEEDEGLAGLIADIQATSALMCRAETELESSAPAGMGGVTREQRYIDLMRTMQFETFEMITECPESGFRFTVPYHFEGTVRAAGERSAPARMKRLAQEAATLATSLPLSYSSSVFVRTDTDRLDVMKVLITGPSDTPYANGCFILDVYFPAEYPAVPMLINLETTGRHSVRFNPNLYNDGKVCLSVLNTWHGRPEEKWNAHTSSFLQVLVSIQSLILVPEPYFNEPGYERSRGTRVGAAASTEYNSNIYQACVRWAMLDQLRNPEPCFKEVIQTHFWMKRNEIIQTVSEWITELEAHQGDERTQRSVHHNAIALKRHYVRLQEELGKLPCPPGLEDLDEPFTLPACSARSPPPDEPAHHEIDHDMEKIVSQVLD